MHPSTLIAAAAILHVAIGGPIDSLLSSTSQHAFGSSLAAVRSPMPVISLAESVADGHDFERLALAVHPDHSLRIKKPQESLCESADVAQYSGESIALEPAPIACLAVEPSSCRAGYLDVSDSRSLFFWAFESRSCVQRPVFDADRSARRRRIRLCSG